MRLDGDAETIENMVHRVSPWQHAGGKTARKAGFAAPPSAFARGANKRTSMSADGRRCEQTNEHVRGWTKEACNAARDASSVLTKEKKKKRCPPGYIATFLRWPAQIRLASHPPFPSPITY
jgi:hypothetical protein